MFCNQNNLKAATGMPDYRIILSTVMLGLFFFSACKKDPVQGPAGTAGKQGNANVTDNQYLVSNPYWHWDATAHAYFQAVTDSAITQSILDKGAVLVYYQYGSMAANTWQPLPFSENGIEWGVFS